jgi:hypothetical protein
VVARPSDVKGLRGHLKALARGRVTSGAAKAAGIAVSAVAASALVTRSPRVLDVALGAGVIAGAAHAANLLDLRPGRALKAGAVSGVALAAGPSAPAVAGPLGAAAALLVSDLDERLMLGDCGSSALGALLGTAFAARTGTAGRAAAVLGLSGLAAAAERVSLTEVIDQTPWLRRLDRLGRRP